MAEEGSVADQAIESEALPRKASGTKAPAATRWVESAMGQTRRSRDVGASAASPRSTDIKPGDPICQMMMPRFDPQGRRQLHDITNAKLRLMSSAALVERRISR
jgi:hypothetical protein